MYTHLVPDRRIRATIKSRLDERNKDQYVDGNSTDTFKVTETIDDRVGGYNFLPALIAFGSRRKQCPLYSANPHGQTESSFLGCAGNDRTAKTGRRVSLQTRNTSQTTQPESVRASRIVVDAYDVNPLSLQGSDDGVSRGPTR